MDTNENGYWWLPDNLEHKVYGTLELDHKDRPILSIYHDPQEQPWQSARFTHDVIFGETASGRITLFNCYENGTSYRIPGLATRKILVDLVIKDMHLASLEAPALRAASIRYSHLDSWAASPRVEIVHKKRPLNFDARYRHAPARKVRIDKDLTVFLFEQISVPAIRTKVRSMRIEPRFGVSLWSKRPESYLYFERLMRLIQDFFSVATLRYCSLESFQVLRAGPETDENRTWDRDEGTVIRRQPFSDPREEPPSIDEMLFCLPAINKQFNKALRNWIAKGELLRPILELYRIAWYAPNQFVGGQYLSLIQAVEAYHRRLVGGCYLASEHFESEVLPLLKAAIPETEDKSFRTAAASRLGFLNEFSLAKRLRSLISDHDELLSVHVSNMKRDVRRIVDLRNTLTHRTESGPLSETDYQDLMYFCRTLKYLLEICFLIEMGIDFDTCRRLVQKNYMYNRTFEGRARRRST